MVRCWVPGAAGYEVERILSPISSVLWLSKGMCSRDVPQRFNSDVYSCNSGSETVDLLPSAI